MIVVEKIRQIREDQEFHSEGNQLTETVANNHLSTHVPKVAPSTSKNVPFLWSFSNFYEIFIIIQLSKSYIAENRQRKMVDYTD